MKLLTLLILFIDTNASIDVISEWETKRTSERVELQYRWVIVGDTLKTRQIKSMFMVKAKPSRIVENFRHAKFLEQWALGAKTCTVFDRADDAWITHTIFDIPPPFKRQDLIAEYRLERHVDRYTICFTALPDYLPSEKGLKRMKHYTGQWEILPLGNGYTEVKYLTTAFSKHMAPRFILDPIMQRLLIESMENLIKLSEHERRL
ncbi:MAG: hypothetical protein MI975_04505 [Cytophagales bacterium]|nr:hypothetical protein [Cytophagales bacterium]